VSKAKKVKKGSKLISSYQCLAIGLILFLPLCGLVLTGAPDNFFTSLHSINPFQIEIGRQDVANGLGKRRITAENLRDTLSFTLNHDQYEIVSTIQLDLQEKIEKEYRRYNPLYAAFVAIDPTSGEILALVDHSQLGHDENLTLRGTFPAASIFKIITSAAALESANMTPQTRVPFNGKFSSLYRRQLSYKTNRWTRYIPFSDALAKSINSIFGKVAVHGIGQEKLQEYANAFGFNQLITFDMPVDISNVIVPEDMFGIAEAGSGYTKEQTMSPLQGALIAATIINDGITPEPMIVKQVLNKDKFPVYEHSPGRLGQPISAKTARQLAMMMERTIIRGTARKTYRDYRRHPILSKLFIGAKTGSLTGTNPQGKYDWFVGFAQSKFNPAKKLAFASMIVNGKYWRVKSAYIAKQVIIKYFADEPSLSATIGKASYD